MKKKIQAILLGAALSMGFLMMNMNTYAEESVNFNKFTIVNPLYEDYVGEIEFPEESHLENITPQMGNVRFSYCDNISSVARQLVPKMVGRNKDVHLRYTQKGLITDQWFEELLEETFQESTRANEGDYLRWSFVKCDISCDVSVVDEKITEDTQYYYDIYLTFQYTTTGKQEDTFEARASQVLQELGVESMRSDYDKLTAIYDYICDNVAYDYENLEDDTHLLKYSAYAALINKSAVCQGYANLFYYLAEEADINTRIIGGVSYGEGHAWNIVKFENAYYNVDATWDAGLDEYEYFLKGSNSFDTEHTRDSAYLTESFIKKYPVPELDYVRPIEFGSGMCGDNVSWSLDIEGTMWISGGGDMYEWESKEDVPWHEFRDEIVDLKFSGEITSIGGYAFAGCKYLATQLVLPDSLETIGYGAFSGCTELVGILILPDNVVTVGPIAFSSCNKIEKIQLSSNMKSIGAGAFANTKCEIDANLPASIEEIGVNAFENAVGLTGDLNLPKGLRSIEQNAFRGCKNIKGDLIIPENVTSIASYSFKDCTGLNGKLVIPETVTSIGEYAFHNCSSLTGNLTLPSGLIEIEDCTFSGCSSLTGKLIIPENVVNIGVGAFSGCSGFTGEFRIPESISVISDSVFKNCKGLTGNLIIPEGITEIGSSAFAYCEGLSGDVILPNSVKELGAFAFEGCTGLTGRMVFSSAMSYVNMYTFEDTFFTGELVLEENIVSVFARALEKATFDKVIIKNKDCKIDDSEKTINKNIVIVGHPNSTAQAYAQKHDRKFECLEHEWSTEPTIDQKPTCEAEGERSIHCVGCDTIKEGTVEILPKVGHKYKWVVDKQATLTKEGKKHETCEYCKKNRNSNTIIGIPTAKVKNSTLVYTGKSISPNVVITDSKGTTLEKGVDYKLSGNTTVKKVGIYSVKVEYIGAYSGSKTLSYKVLPKKVENLKAELSGGHDDVSISWSKSEGASGYYVSYKKHTSSTYSAQKRTTKTTYKLSDLSDGVEYDIRVIPYYKSGESRYTKSSEYAYASVVTQKELKAPATVTVVLYNDYNDVKVSWSKTSGATGYYVYYKATSDAEYKQLTRTTSRSTTKAKDLKDGVKYTFKIVPYYIYGGERISSVYSKTATVYTLKKLAVPKLTKSSSKVKVTWNNINGETGYQISQSTAKTKTNIVATYSTTSGKYKTVSATKNKKYYYKVRAYKTVNGKKIYGPWSDVVEYVRK